MKRMRTGNANVFMESSSSSSSSSFHLWRYYVRFLKTNNNNSRPICNYNRFQFDCHLRSHIPSSGTDTVRGISSVETAMRLLMLAILARPEMLILTCSGVLILACPEMLILTCSGF